MNQKCRQPRVDALNGQLTFTNDSVNFAEWVHVVRVC